MDIKILSTGCCSASSLERRVRAIVDAAGIDASVETVDDMKTIMSYGVMSTPALVVDGEVKVAGRAPSAAEIPDLLTSSPS